MAISVYRHGRWFFQAFLAAVVKEGDPNIDPRPGQRWQDHVALQTEGILPLLMALLAVHHPN